MTSPNIGSVDLAAIRVGDEVTVKARVYEVGRASLGLVPTTCVSPPHVALWALSHEIVSHSPKALCVGDRVRGLGGSAIEGKTGTVKAECDGYFWVQTAPGLDPVTCHPAWLERLP